MAESRGLQEILSLPWQFPGRRLMETIDSWEIQERGVNKKPESYFHPLLDINYILLTRDRPRSDGMTEDHIEAPPRPRRCRSYTTVCACGTSGAARILHNSPDEAQRAVQFHAFTDLLQVAVHRRFPRAVWSEPPPQTAL